MAGELLTTAQAAARLGIKRETLYAYVSRGAIGRLPDPNGRGSLFRAEDVAALAAQRGTGQRGSGNESGSGTTLSIVSAVTTIANGQLAYRGHDVADLAGRYGFESVAELLWTGALPETVPRWFPSDLGGPAAVEVASALPPSTLPADRLLVFVAAAAAGDNLRSDLRPEAVHAIGRSLLAAAAELLADGGRGATVAERLGHGWGVRRSAWVEVIDAALVLLADHELATSTMAVRVAASVRADPYHALLAGLAAMSGPLHGSAGALVHRLLVDAADRGPERAIGDVLRQEGRLPGFGHGLYPQGDPRLRLLLDRVRAAAPTGDRRLALVDAVLHASSARLPVAPNVDYGLAALAYVAGWEPGRVEALFSLARMAGWLAHALEEYEAPPLRYRLTALTPPGQPTGGIPGPG